MNERSRAILEAHLVLERDGHLLLLRRSNTGYEDGKYSLVAGHFDGDESGRQAMIREAREEAGIEIAASDLTLFHVMHRNADAERVSFFYTTPTWGGEPQNMEPHKCDDLAWFRRDALPENMVSYVERAVMLGFEGVRYSELGWTMLDQCEFRS